MRYTNSEKISESYLAKEREKVMALLENKNFPFMAEYRERLEDVLNLDDRYEQLRQYVDLHQEISDFLKSEAFTKEVAKYYATQDDLESELFFRNYLDKHPVAYDGNFTEVQEFAVQFYREDFSRMIITQNVLTLLNNEMFAKDLISYYLMNPEYVNVMRKAEDVNLSFFVELIFLRFPVAKVGCLTKLQSLGLEFCKKYQVYSQFIFETKFAYWEDWCENNSKLSVAFLKGVMNIPDEELLVNVFMLYRESNDCHYRSTVRHDPENVFWTKGKSREKAYSVNFSFGINAIVPSPPELIYLITGNLHHLTTFSPPTSTPSPSSHHSPLATTNLFSVSVSSGVFRFHRRVRSYRICFSSVLLHLV